MQADRTITCVECGATAGRLEREGEEWLPGDVVTYFCPSCRHRYDLILVDDPPDPHPPEGPGHLPDLG